VDECKPLLAAPSAAVAAGVDVTVTGLTPGLQGLTLVHFSAQPEPFVTQKRTLNIPYQPLTPRKHLVSTPSMHTLSRRKRLSRAQK